MSVLLHLVLFGYLARVTPMLRTPVYAPQPDVQLELAPLPAVSEAPAAFAPRRSRTPAQQTPHSTLTPRRATPQRAAPARAIAAPRPAPAVAPRAPPPPTARAGVPVPAVGARAGAGQATAGGAAHGAGDSEAGDEGRGGVRAFLRATVGCSHQAYAHLTVKERAACAQRLGHDAGAVQDAQLDPLSAQDRASFNAVRDAEEAMRRKRAPAYDCSLLNRGDCGVGGSTAQGTQGLVPHP